MESERKQKILNYLQIHKEKLKILYLKKIISAKNNISMILHTTDKLLGQLSLLDLFKQVFQNIIKIRLNKVVNYTLNFDNLKIDLRFFDWQKFHATDSLYQPVMWIVRYFSCHNQNENIFLHVFFNLQAINTLLPT